MKYECDCGRYYSDVDSLHVCANNRHYQPDPMKEAAYEMYEILKQILEITDDVTWGTYDTIGELARNALAKAEGKP